MGQHLILQQKQALRQRLSARQIQLIQLLGLSAQEFEQRVKNEIEENPALEELPNEEVVDVAELPVNIWEIENLPSYKSGGQRSASLGDVVIPDRGMSLQSVVLQQIMMLPLSEKEQQLCVYLAGCLDSDGYLRRAFADIANDILFSFNTEPTIDELEQALQSLQSIEPAGIGARNLQECLLLQLTRKDDSNPNVALAKQIVSQWFDDFSHKRYDKIAEQLNIEKSMMERAVAEIVKLDPKPGNAFDNSDNAIAPTVFPDFLVEYKNGELTQTLITRHLPKLRVNNEYDAMLQRFAQSKQRVDKNAQQFAQQKVSDAQWFINAVQQRAQTLELVMAAIARHQQQFFITGDELDLQPLTQQTIAQQTGYDVSTISRTISNKYVQTNFGILPLKYFFVTKTVNTDGDDVSVQQIKNSLTEIVLGEDKKNPLTDEEISALLYQKGFKTARRTVAKYRSQLGIDAMQMRKET